MHDDFFRELDGRWSQPTPVRIPLRVIGSAALMMRFDHHRATSDGDVIEAFQAMVDLGSRTHRGG